MLMKDIERTMSGYAQRFPGDNGVIAELWALRQQKAEITSRKGFAAISPAGPSSSAKAAGF